MGPRVSDTRSRLLSVAERWEQDADAEEARIGVRAEHGYGRADTMRRVAAGMRRLADTLGAARC